MGITFMGFTITSIIIICLVVGTIFSVLEVCTPGMGIFGFIGIIAVIISVVLTFFAFPFPIGLFVMAAELATLGAIVYAMFRYVRKSQLYGKLILDETLEFEKKDIAGLDYFLGKIGTTKTPLKPVGMVDFNGIPMEVTSTGTFISANRSVKVIEVIGSKIIVTEQNTN